MIRAVTLDDRQVWLDLAHESDGLVMELVPDIATFYEGFDDYMVRKITQHEAFMVVDRASSGCLGIIAFSNNHNRISFLGVTGDADFKLIASRLMETALNKLDNTQEISISVLKSDSEIIKNEFDLYELFGFVKRNEEVVEAVIPAYVMRRPAMSPVSNEGRT